MMITAVLSLLVLGSKVRDGLLGPRPAAAAQPAERPETTDVFVSPQGRDDWSGRLADPGGSDGPVATIARAKQENKPGVAAVLRGTLQARKEKMAADKAKGEKS